MTKLLKTRFTSVCTLILVYAKYILEIGHLNEVNCLSESLQSLYKTNNLNFVSKIMEIVEEVDFCLCLKFIICFFICL